jgi:hypothetical protein
MFYGILDILNPRTYLPLFTLAHQCNETSKFSQFASQKSATWRDIEECNMTGHRRVQHDETQKSATWRDTEECNMTGHAASFYFTPFGSLSNLICKCRMKRSECQKNSDAVCLRHTAQFTSSAQEFNSYFRNFILVPVSKVHRCSHKSLPLDYSSTEVLLKCTVVYLLKVRSVEPEKQSLLGNGSEITFVSRQRSRNRKWYDVRC